MFQNKKKWILLILVIIIIGGVFNSIKNKKDISPSSSPRPSSIFSTGQMLIGIEYAAPGMAEIFSELGVPAVKYYPDEIALSKIQKKQGADFDFGPMDKFVKEYQGAGFSELIIALKANGAWFVKDKKNNSPKSEYLRDYSALVGAIVERYDADGKDDMPGLKHPVRYYEVGTEFSSYEPESASDYITMLEAAYKSAHAASKDVAVANAAFLATTAFKDNPSSSQYSSAFNKVDKRIMEHSLSDIRKILDRPDIFDVVDFHALGDPLEIEDTVRWLNYEMNARGYKKPIIIGDTTISPFIAWGAATTCKGEKLGVIVPPATEADRCRLADFFSKLVDDDKDAISAIQAFSAEDMVKRVVIAAEQGVSLINTGFMEDLTLFTNKIFKAAAGTSPWSGMTSANINVLNKNRTIKEIRPSFYAIKQLVSKISGYSNVERVNVSNNNVRLYKFTKNSKPIWVAWLDPGKLILPGDQIPSTKLQIQTGSSNLTAESIITKKGQTVPEKTTIKTPGGVAEINLTPTPVIVY